MHRDMDYVRDILLGIEAKKLSSSEDLLINKENEDEFDKLSYHLTMLVEEAELVSGNNYPALRGKIWANLRLTWKGHDYLDAIRDPEIWIKTKEGAKIAGGFTLDLLAALAKGLLKKKIEHHTGIELDL